MSRKIFTHNRSLDYMNHWNGTLNTRYPISENRRKDRFIMVQRIRKIE